MPTRKTGPTGDHIPESAQSWEPIAHPTGSLTMGIQSPFGAFIVLLFVGMALSIRSAGAQVIVRFNNSGAEADARITVAELVRGVNLALGRIPVENGGTFDADGGDTVTVNELIGAGCAAFNGCDPDQ